jgi:hypothetical protein
MDPQQDEAHLIVSGTALPGGTAEINILINSETRAIPRGRDSTGSFSLTAKRLDTCCPKGPGDPHNPFIVQTSHPGARLRTRLLGNPSFGVAKESPHPLRCKGDVTKTMDSRGGTIWIADAHCDDGKRFVVHADEKLTAFLEVESATQTFR